MTVYVSVGIDEPCRVELKGFKTEEEAKKYTEEMNNNSDSYMIWYDVQEINID